MCHKSRAKTQVLRWLTVLDVSRLQHVVLPPRTVLRRLPPSIIGLAASHVPPRSTTWSFPLPVCALVTQTRHSRLSVNRALLMFWLPLRRLVSSILPPTSLPSSFSWALWHLIFRVNGSLSLKLDPGQARYDLQILNKSNVYNSKLDRQPL